MEQMTSIAALEALFSNSARLVVEKVMKGRRVGRKVFDSVCMNDEDNLICCCCYYCYYYPYYYYY